jgi:sulfite reductase alpha subunit-like flavoprotein
MNRLGEIGVQNTSDERTLTILYATQTGNAQDLAESLARLAVRKRFTTRCLSVEDYTLVAPVRYHINFRRTFLVKLV